jgi:hypothetical protein
MAQKSGRTEQSGYQFKIRTPACKMSRKHLCTIDQQEEKSIEPVRAGVEENNKRIRKTHNYTEHARDKRTYIWYYKKDNGVTITLI